MANENNRVRLKGTLCELPSFSHRIYGEGFYSMVLAVPRLSGAADYVPITVSERLLTGIDAEYGQNLAVDGQFRSYNNYSDTGSRLQLTVFTKSIENIEEDDISEPNDIFLDGYLCKEPIYRQTPFGREISDMLIAVNRAYNKSDYIPVIAWSRNARFCSGLPVGTHIKIYGRVQSREYQKKTEEDYIVKTAYEISASKLEMPEE
ncbi:MAG: single-stranded DNA-binding protein [Bacillota bacterium]|nr:single-stranded DNA-binding protein [Bacillota bacterium]